MNKKEGITSTDLKACLILKIWVKTISLRRLQIYSRQMLKRLLYVENLLIKCVLS